MNKQEIEKVINYMQNMDLSVFIDKDEACGVIDMVTKLLQQQLTNESEIKRLQDEVESLRNWNACEKEQYSDLLKSDKRRIELEEENEELRKQLTNGWIPVSEGLPSFNDVCDITRNGIVIEDVIYQGINDGEDTWLVHSSSGDYKYIPVYSAIAWRNHIIPEPYKELATDINVTTKTIGDKIRESNESLANEIMKFGQRCYDCDYKEKPECNVKSCKDGILEYLNQPYTE